MILALIGISMPVFWLGEVAEPPHPAPVPQLVPLRVGAAARLHAVHAGPGQVVRGPRDPVDHALGALHRRLRARAPGEPARGAERGLRPHGTGQGALGAAGAHAAHSEDVDDHVREPVRPRLRRAGRRAACSWSRSCSGSTASGFLTYQSLTQPRPARRSWRPSSTARSSSCSRTRSSTSPTPGSIRGSGSPDGRAAARGHGSQGLVPHRGRPRAGGRRRQLLDRKGRGARHRRRVRLRQERHA